MPSCEPSCYEIELFITRSGSPHAPFASYTSVLFHLYNLSTILGRFPLLCSNMLVFPSLYNTGFLCLEGMLATLLLYHPLTSMLAILKLYGRLYHGIHVTMHMTYANV